MQFGQGRRKAESEYGGPEGRGSVGKGMPRLKLILYLIKGAINHLMFSAISP